MFSIRYPQFTNIALLALILAGHGATQSLSFSSTSQPSSTQQPSASNIPTITYPNLSESAIALASFQDTVEVSWTPLPGDKNITLEVICWDRHSDWHNTAPIVNVTLNSQLESAQSYNVSLTPYKIYNPCRFDLSFFSYGNFTLLLPSGAVAINETNDSKGPTTWTIGHPAPMGNPFTNVTRNSGARRAHVGGNVLAGTALLSAIGALML